MIDALLSKARQALTTGARDLEGGDPDAAANRCYYAAFYAAWALFSARGLEKPKTHGGLIAEFGRRFVTRGPFDRNLGAALGKLESLRSYADYTLDPTPTEKAELALGTARAFVEAIEHEIHRHRAASDAPSSAVDVEKQ